MSSGQQQQQPNVVAPASATSVGGAPPRVLIIPPLLPNAAQGYEWIMRARERNLATQYELFLYDLSKLVQPAQVQQFQALCNDWGTIQWRVLEILQGSEQLRFYPESYEEREANLEQQPIMGAGEATDEEEYEEADRDDALTPRDVGDDGGVC